MGSGKSTLGPLLSQRLRIPFLDLDEVIVREQGRGIPEIFRQGGEAQFRRIETEALRATSAGGPCVIALGGGAFCFPANVDIVRSSGTSVWLKVTLQEAENRCQGDTERPLAQDPIRFRQLYQSRLEHYERADLAIETAEKSPSFLVEEIAQRILSMNS